MASELAAAIRHEHEELRAQIESLRVALYDDHGASAEREATILRTLDWFKERLLPHAHEEEAHLYPEVDNLVDSRGAKATDTMLMDHEQIRSLVEQLEELMSNPSAHGSRHSDWVHMLAAQLEIMLTLHFRKEEAVYLHLLDSA